jgi:Fibronectin type III domain
MKKRVSWIVAGIAALPTVAIVPALGYGAPAKPVRLAEATLIVEVNATDGDAGLQVFLDGEPWRSMRITDPNGREIAAVNAVGRLTNYGLTELFSESSEPPFDEFPLARFKRLFPEGRYTFAGETIEGEKLTGAARLSHDIPRGPRIVSPGEGTRVDRTALVASWNAPPKRAGVEIAVYRAIVTREEPLRVFSADLPRSARRVTVPTEFLEPGVEYKLEVQAIEKSGNQTLTEVTFRAR